MDTPFRLGWFQEEFALVLVERSANGRTLTQVVDDYVREYEGQFSLTRQSIMLGGEPAEVVEGIPGRSGSRQVFIIHNDTVYHWSLYPVDEAFPQAAPDVEAVWQAAVESFTFLSK